MINPWTQGRVPGVRMVPTLGAWQNSKKMASAAWVPPQWARLSLQGGHLYWYAFPELHLLPAQTDLTRVTVSEDFWVTAVMGKNSQEGEGGSGTFRFLIYEDEQTYKWSKYAENQSNAAPIAQEPGLVKMPHFIRAGSPVNCRVQNLVGGADNIVNICMFGYSAWWRI